MYIFSTGNVGPFNQCFIRISPTLSPLFKLISRYGLKSLNSVIIRAQNIKTNNLQIYCLPFSILLFYLKQDFFSPFPFLLYFTPMHPVQDSYNFELSISAVCIYLCIYIIICIDEQCIYIYIILQIRSRVTRSKDQDIILVALQIIWLHGYMIMDRYIWMNGCGCIDG